MAEYSKAASKKDKVITKMERFINTAGFFILHFIRKVQYPMVPALAYYIIKINMVEHDQWTHDKEEGKRFCEGNDAHTPVWSSHPDDLGGHVVDGGKIG